jgi:Uma2 family endonuclease
METLVLDPRQSERLQAERQARGLDGYDEVWDGVYVMAPSPNDEHQQVSIRLARPFLEVVEDAELGIVRPCVNLAIDPNEWQHNYRIPDLAVFLNGSAAVCHDSFWSGPPDFIVEIVSPFDKTREKLAFYAQLGTREVLIVDRAPWKLELFKIENQLAAPVQTVLPDDGNWIESAALPIRLRLIDGKARPAIEIASTVTGKSWMI